MSFDPIPLPAHNPGPMTGSGNVTYLIVGRDATATLIDAGQGIDTHLAEVAAVLDRHGARLTRVLVTHGHPDHASGARALAAAHPGAAFMKRPWPGQDDRYPVGWMPLADDHAIDAGGTILRVQHTPGHSPDHLAFWHEESRTIFAGDLVMPGGSVMIHASRGGDLGQYLRSLERVRALKPARLLPAHGGPVDDPEHLLAGTIEHRLSRERQVVAALVDGRATAQAIAGCIYDGLAPALMPAACETVRAHLEELRREGRAAEAAGRWTP
jgi:glyoxylase-like metal-dependent hydrolase (beta-lactamase superfamily II)